ncbi:MAG: Cys-tRNA(Pro) deacylase [Clostridia bacterium]|nr:Cys-tRNA(Pro) deacylase [Clostridia bacterium]
MGKQDKTNCMRVLESKKIAYAPHLYEADPTLSGGDIAAILGEDPSQVFKTLVTVGKPQKYYVFVVPVNEELNLKKAAAAAGEKSVCMIPQKDLLPLTGYVHGGCSPIGMKKRFPSFIHRSAAGLSRIFVSAGRVGCQVELDPADLIRVAELVPADLA